MSFHLMVTHPTRFGHFSMNTVIFLFIRNIINCIGIRIQPSRFYVACFYSISCIMLWPGNLTLISYPLKMPMFSFSSIIPSPNLVPLYSQLLWQLDLLWRLFFLVSFIHIQLMPWESLVSLSHFHLLDFVSGTRFNKRKRNKLKPIKLKNRYHGQKNDRLTWLQMTINFPSAIIFVVY